jgi:Secretion system C-terminal sorting domain
MKKPLIIIIFFLYSVKSTSQIQIGSDILGTQNGEYLGFNVAYGENALAVSSPFNLDTINIGKVQVFNLINNEWKLKGNVILGTDKFDAIGNGLSISKDGNKIAIGYPGSSKYGYYKGMVKVFNYISGTWIQEGDDILGKEIADLAGSSVELSDHGQVLAVGYPTNSDPEKGGQIKTFQLTNGNWVQIGQIINGETYDYLGKDKKCISLSFNGKIMAIGNGSNSNIGGAYTGRVDVYKYESNKWERIGSPLIGEKWDNFFGEIVSLSSDGNMLAVTAIGNKKIANYSGSVTTYSNISNVWVKTGEINGEFDYNVAGRSMSLSRDGRNLAIGYSNHKLDTTGHGGYGAVKFFQYDSILGWKNIGKTITGEFEKERSAFCIALSPDAKKIAVNSFTYSQIAPNAGRVRVFDLSTIVNTKDPIIPNVEIFPNPVSNSLFIKIEDNNKLIKVNIYDNLGKLKLVSTNSSIKIDELNSGNYFVNIITENGNICKKIVVE